MMVTSNLFPICICVWAWPCVGVPTRGCGQFTSHLNNVWVNGTILSSL